MTNPSGTTARTASERINNNNRRVQGASNNSKHHNQSAWINNGSI